VQQAPLSISHASFLIPHASYMQAPHDAAGSYSSYRLLMQQAPAPAPADPHVGCRLLMQAPHAW